jgi:NAD+ diphosphatase
MGGSSFDRAAHRRADAAWLAGAVGDPGSRLLVVSDRGEVPLGTEGRLDWRPLTGGPSDDLVFLGLGADKAALFAVCDTPMLRACRVVSLREVAAELEEIECAAALEAVALTGWHRRHRFCSCCGAPSLPTDAGHRRLCTACGTEHFPRTDPAVIMLVSDGERCVLARRPGPHTTRWSTLAGYVEPGESPEAAVVREVFEEVGLEVHAVHYRGSQPWPFSSSLMLAFTAEVGAGDLVRSDEHEEVRWFSRDEIRDAIAAGTLVIPGPLAAGHVLIMEFAAAAASEGPRASRAASSSSRAAFRDRPPA